MKLLVTKRGWEAAGAGESCCTSQVGFSRGAPRPGPRRDARRALPGTGKAGESPSLPAPQHWPAPTRGAADPRRRAVGPLAAPRSPPVPTGKWARESPEGAGPRRAIGRRVQFDTESCARVGGPRPGGVAGPGPRAKRLPR